jgi:acetylornithine deacetylase
VEGGKLFGRGASDMIGGFAALVMAVKCLIEEEIRLNGDVIIESVVDEERGGNGTLACILRGYKADAGIIGEPTNLEVHIAHAGSTWFRIKIEGRAAHGGLRYEGVSAIEKAVQIHEALLKLEAQRSRSTSHPLFKAYPNPVPLNIGTIKAGVWPSTVLEECIMEGRIGYLPNERINSVRHQLEDCVKQTVKKDDWMRKHQPKVEWLGLRDASIAKTK